MTKDQYFAALRSVANEVIDLAELKGAQYWDEDPFAAFREIGALTGIPKEGALMVLSSKHWGALAKVALGHRREGQGGTLERIKDVILYMLILYLMFSNPDKPNLIPISLPAKVIPVDDFAR